MYSVAAIGVFAVLFGEGVLVNQMLHITRRAKALGLHYEARLRGLELCAINLTSTVIR
jgi:hypothetical protein